MIRVLKVSKVLIVDKYFFTQKKILKTQKESVPILNFDEKKFMKV